ncbi:MAG: DEAD/DEAH box helicase [Dehalococcoidia bacterium]|nr:MAG: DEAD/DEAH box helicase [Dehalococcoidia bacterium]
MHGVSLDPLTEEKQHYLSEINKYFNNGNSAGYIKVPTGWGKTFLSKHLMNQYYERGEVILFLVSGNNQLLNQTFYNDGKIKIPLFSNSVILSSEHGKIDISELQKRIQTRAGGIAIFASLQTVLSKNNKEIEDILIKSADLAIIDEVHNFINNRGNDFINKIKDSKAQILGMTATPFQGVIGQVKFVDDISIDMREIFSKSLPQCIIEGQLSELDYVIIRSNQNILDLFDFQKGLSELDKDELYLDCGSREKIDLTIRRTKLAKKVYETEIPNKKSKTLIFCAPVRNIVQGLESEEKKIIAFHAKMCSAVFNGELRDTIGKSFSFNNHTDTDALKDTVYLSSEMPQTERDEILKAFRTANSPPFTLCTVGMLIEGFDFPDLENLILLRPTLSMRLFEQQVGRVTRLPKESNKKRGNIFEIADNIDSLYDAFKEKVFEGNNIERIQMLQPENRIEELFTEDNATEAIATGKIRVSDINFGCNSGEFAKSTVEIPPISLRAKSFCKLLSIIEKQTEGMLVNEKLRLLRMVRTFSPRDLDSIKEVMKLVELLERLEHNADEDPRLSANCRKHKPKLFREARWLLLLTILTNLKYLNTNEGFKERNEILSILGFGNDYTQVDALRMQCLREGCRIETLDALTVEVKNVAILREILPNWSKTSLKQSRYKNKLSYIYWASCFAMEQPEIRQLLYESREWNYEAKRFIIG